MRKGLFQDMERKKDHCKELAWVTIQAYCFLFNEANLIVLWNRQTKCSAIRISWTASKIHKPRLFQLCEHTWHILLNRIYLVWDLGANIYRYTAHHLWHALKLQEIQKFPLHLAAGYSTIPQIHLSFEYFSI